MEVWLYPAELLAGTGQQAHHCHSSGENSERCSCIKLLLQLRAAFSSGPQKGVQTVGWEMGTARAQIFCEEFPSPPCSFVLGPTRRHFQRPMAQQSAGRSQEAERDQTPLLAVRTTKKANFYPESEIAYTEHQCVNKPPQERAPYFLIQRKIHAVA